MSTVDDLNVNAAVTAKPSQTELEMAAGHRAAERYTAHAAPKTNGIPFSLETIDTGIVAAVTAKQPQAEAIKGGMPPAESSPAPMSVDQGEALHPDDAADPDASLAFLNDFFGPGKRHLVAIKKGKKPEIKAHHFDADDRAGQRNFITDCSTAGFDLYFSPNPIKGTLHKKAKKSDVAEARQLWIDLDPRPGEPLEVERTTMLALLTTDLPPGVPRPNRVIDSGRGYWGYWELDKPLPVDGAVYDDKGHFVRNNSLTDIVENYGKGIEQAFGDRFADGCRNIDRVARLVGTVNTKTGRIASVRHEHSEDTPHAIEGFRRSVEQPKEQEAPKANKFTPAGKYKTIEPDDPLLANLGDKWRAMLNGCRLRGCVWWRPLPCRDRICDRGHARRNRPRHARALLDGRTPAIWR